MNPEIVNEFRFSWFFRKW